MYCLSVLSLRNLCIFIYYYKSFSVLFYLFVDYKTLFFICIGSNGYLYSNELYAETNSNDFPGKQLTEITLINLNKQVTLIQLSSDCIGLYGAEPKGDG